MKVCICGNCKNAVHVGMAFGTSCLFCGSVPDDIPETESTYLLSVISECENVLMRQDYDMAVRLYDKYIDRFPNVSALYWGRMMARNGCRNDWQLLLRGVKFSMDPDFMHAMEFAAFKEQQCYLTLDRVREEFGRRIVTVLEKKRDSDIFHTNVCNIQASAQKRLDDLNQLLLGQIRQMDDIEKQLKDNTADCLMYIKSGRKMIDDTIAGLEKIKDEIFIINQAEDDETDDFSVLMKCGNILCDEGWGMIRKLKETSVYRERDGILKRQKEIENEIAETLKEIEGVRSEMENLLVVITRIRQSYQTVIARTKDHDFAEAASLIGSDTVSMIGAEVIRSLQGDM